MKLFADDQDSDGLYDDAGYANTVYSYLNNYTRSGIGIIYRKQEGIDDTLERMDITIRRKEEYMEKRREALTEQFEAVNKALQQLEARIQALNNTLSGNLELASGALLR